MKKYLFFFLILPLGISAQVPVAYKARFCKLLIDKYCKDLDSLIMQDNLSIGFYCGTNSRTDWVDALPSIIHEAFHRYNTHCNDHRGSGPTRIYFFNNKLNSIHVDNFFMSSEIFRIVPSPTRDSIDRYATYIAGTDGSGDAEDSKVHGIYGLVEEFGAYCYSLKAYVSAYQFMKANISPDSSAAWIGYLAANSSLVYSYYEFKLFIAWYYRLARQRFTGKFDALLSNKGLTDLIREIDEEFARNIATYWSNRKELLDRMRGKAMIRHSHILNVSDGTEQMLPDDTIDYLKKLLEKEEER